VHIVIGSFSHESNSFNPDHTQLDDFSPRLYGDQVLDALRTAGRTALHGIFDTLTTRGSAVTPTVFARAVPGGLVSQEAYYTIKEELLQRLKRADSVDGVCLHLHGSMTVAGLGDAEGDLLASVREIVGPQIPIVCSLDMHAMVTPAMVACADGLVGYRTAPHVDAYETGANAAKLLHDALQGHYGLAMCAVGLPMLVSGEQSETEKYPMNELIPKLEEAEQQGEVLSASYFLGFPWVDVSYNQGSAVVVCREEQSRARDQAEQLARHFWHYHKEFRFTTEAYPFAEALAAAETRNPGPVCIADCGDNPGAGGSQNIVYPLKHMLEKGTSCALFGSIADPASYRRCADEGIGSQVKLRLGRLSTGELVGLAVEGTVTHIGPLGAVPAAVVRIQGIDVVVSSRRAMMVDPEELRALDLEPEEYGLLVLKSGYLDPKYEAIAGHGLLALTPGYTNQNFRDLEYRHVPRPMYPLDKDFEYNPRSYRMC